MDMVRIFGVVAVLEIPYFFAWKMGVFSMYSDAADNYEQMVAGIGALLFETGVLHAGILFALSRVRYFCLPVAPRILLRRALVAIPVFIALHFLQNEFAYSSFSSSRPH